MLVYKMSTIYALNKNRTTVRIAFVESLHHSTYTIDLTQDNKLFALTSITKLEIPQRDSVAQKSIDSFIFVYTYFCFSPETESHHSRNFFLEAQKMFWLL